jgi:hypothetical protein
VIGALSVRGMNHLHHSKVSIPKRRKKKKDPKNKEKEKAG